MAQQDEHGDVRTPFPVRVAVDGRDSEHGPSLLFQSLVPRVERCGPPTKRGSGLRRVLPVGPDEESLPRGAQIEQSRPNAMGERG